MSRSILHAVILVLSLACWLVAGSQNPGHLCPGGATNLVNGFASECDLATIDGLHGRSASQILYEVIMEADLDNSTFFANDMHITCLFQNTSFALSGTHIGVGPVTIEIPPIQYQGTLCLYVENVLEGGLNLGQIRNLTRTYILTEGCNKCGWITANIFSGNKTQEGDVRIDWRKNANCIENCIDPEKDLATNKTTKPNGGATIRDHGAYVGSLSLLAVIAMLL